MSRLETKIHQAKIDKIVYSISSVQCECRCENIVNVMVKPPVKTIEFECNSCGLMNFVKLKKRHFGLVVG